MALPRHWVSHLCAPIKLSCALSKVTLGMCGLVHGFWVFFPAPAPSYTRSNSSLRVVGLIICAIQVLSRCVATPRSAVDPVPTTHPRRPARYNPLYAQPQSLPHDVQVLLYIACGAGTAGRAGACPGSGGDDVRRRFASRGRSDSLRRRHLSVHSTRDLPRGTDPLYDPRLRHWHRARAVARRCVRGRLRRATVPPPWMGPGAPAAMATCILMGRSSGAARPCAPPRPRLPAANGTCNPGVLSTKNKPMVAAVAQAYLAASTPRERMRTPLRWLASALLPGWKRTRRLQLMV